MSDRDQSTFPKDYPVEKLLTQTSLSVVITNPRLEDNPIVFVNRAFEQTTGYSRAVALGNNCRFLQGADTDPKAVTRIRNALADEVEVTVTLKNYRADGTPFWNELRLSPIFDDSGVLTYVLGIQRIVPSPDGKTPEVVAQDLMLQEIQHRVKNHLAMIVSLIRSQANQPASATSEGFLNLARRVEALQLLYEQLHTETTTHETLDIGAYISQIVAGVMQMNPSRTVRVNHISDSAEVSVDLAVQVGLILSELLTNSLQHAFEGRNKGSVDVSVTKQTTDLGTLLRLVVSDNGVGFDMGDDWPSSGGSGSRIVKGMTDFSNAVVSAKSGADGTRVQVDFPFRLSGPPSENPPEI
ncbi:MAG: PAS domain-containing protein [Pseudomonadota bacterium]